MRQRCVSAAARWTSLACTAALLSAAVVSTAGERSGPVQGTGMPAAADGPGPPGPAPALPWDSFTGDLTIRHRRVEADGTSAGTPPPGMVLRIDQRRVGGRWRTTLDVIATDPIWVQSPAGRRLLENPFAPTRLEFDDTGGPPRMYDRRGQLIKGPGPADIRALGVPPALRKRDWEPEELIARAPSPRLVPARGPAEGLVSLVSERASRRQDLERRFGPSRGQVRGLDRFLDQSGDTTHELLVDRGTALPVEINVADRGRLVSHAVLEYQSVDGTAHVRRRIHNEQVVADPGGPRLVTDIELTNVRLTQGRR